MLAVVPLCAVPLTAWWDGIASLPSGAVFPLQAQTIGEQDACSIRYGIESRFLSTWKRRFAHSLLEQFGGITQPRFIHMGDCRVNCFLVGGLIDGGEGIQNGGVGLPTTFGICLHHVSQRSPGQRCVRQIAQD